MSRITLFKPPPEFEACVNDLGHDLGEGERGRDLARLLLHVELGFSLMERLRFDDEPVTAAWAVLSGMPLRHPRLQSLDAADRRAVANARQIVPYSSRFAWLEAVRSYFRLPTRFRQYRLDERLSPADIDQVILSAIRVKARDQIRDYLYERCLCDPLEFHRRPGLPPVRAGMQYEFTAKLAKNPKEHIVSALLHKSFSVVADAAGAVFLECEPQEYPTRLRLAKAEEAPVALQRAKVQEEAQVPHPQLA